MLLQLDEQAASQGRAMLVTAMLAYTFKGADMRRHASAVNDHGMYADQKKLVVGRVGSVLGCTINFQGSLCTCMNACM